MDPVSRRLAAAAMGLAFGLSRDEELEKTRLDLERARMEREDFRNGAGPVTEMLQASQVNLGKKHFARMYATALNPSYVTVNQRLRTDYRSFDEVRTDLEYVRDELGEVRTLLGRCVRETHKEGRVSLSTLNESATYFDERSTSQHGDDGHVSIISDSSDDEDIADISMSED